MEFRPSTISFKSIQKSANGNWNAMSSKFSNIGYFYGFHLLRFCMLICDRFNVIFDDIGAKTLLSVQFGTHVKFSHPHFKGKMNRVIKKVSKITTQFIPSMVSNHLFNNITLTRRACYIQNK